MKKTSIRVGIGWAALVALLSIPLKTIEASAPQITGYIESNYMFDFNDPSTRTTALRSYDATANSFYLNAAHIALVGELQEGVGYTLEVDYGQDATVTSAGNEVDLQEAYLNFPLKWFNITAGKFVTYEGIEVIEGPDNPTISRGYLFGLAEAFGHVGVKAHVGLGEHVDVGVGLVNGRDVNVDNNKGKTVIWRLGLDLGDPFSVGFSGSHGPFRTAVGTNADEDQLTSLDLTGNIGFIPDFPIAFQVLYAQADNLKGGTKVGSWSGFGLQPVLELTEKLSIGSRVEYFDDLNGWSGNGTFTATNYTLTPTYKLNEAITLRAEVRRDIVNSTGGSAGPFMDSQGKALGTATTVSTGFIYKFE